MPVDRLSAHAEIPRDDPNQRVLAFGFKNFGEFALATPRFGSILIVGDETEGLTEELAISRYDINVTNITPTSPDMAARVPRQPDTPLNNAQFITSDIASLGNLLPESHFDRIYYSAEVDNPQELFDTLRTFLKDDGVLRINNTGSDAKPMIVAKNGSLEQRPLPDVVIPYQKKSFLLEDIRDASIVAATVASIAALALKRWR